MVERFLAFVNKTDTEFLPEFARHDAYLKSFRFEQSEGDFASLTIEIERPTAPLLSPTRKQWAWLSEQRGSDLVPLFFGHIIGLPADLQDEFYTVEFMARPAGFQATKRALAETLKVAPFWDYAFVDPQRYRDPDAVLETRAAAWHIDPVSHAVTISSMVEGEDGTLAVEAEHVAEDGFRLTYGQAPLKRVDLEIRAMWTQVIRKTIDLAPALYDAFAAAGSPAGRISSFTGEGLLQDWPRQGEPIGSGWKYGKQRIRVIDGVEVAKRFATVPVANAVPPAEADGSDNPFNPAFNPFPSIGVTEGGPYVISYSGQNVGNVDDQRYAWNNRREAVFPEYSIGVHSPGEPYVLSLPDWAEDGGAEQNDPVGGGTPGGGDGGGAGGETSNNFYYRNWQMRVDRSEAVADAKIDRTEDIVFSVVSDMQAVSADPADETSETVTLSSGLIGTRIHVGSYSELPIGDVGADVYFPTERGLESIEFGLALAHAKIMRRARAAEISVNVPYELATAASLRKSATVDHPKLPGGTATGKIIGITFGVDGDTGVEDGVLRIACLVGLGSNLTAGDGTPVFVDDDYVEEDYQEREGEERSILDGAIVYPVPVAPDPDMPEPDLLGVTVANGEAVQSGVLAGAFADANEASDALNAVATSVDVEMTEIDESPRFVFYDGGTVDLVVPMGIDLGEG